MSTCTHTYMHVDSGIVHNMVFDSSLYVNEIKAFCGLDMLLEVRLDVCFLCSSIPLH